MAGETGLKLSELDLSNGFYSAWLLAEDSPASPFELPLPLLFAIMFALFYFIILRPQQSKDKKFRTLLENLKEKDRVVTVGGIHGVVTSVLRDRNEVTLRIDESTGTKIRIGTSAIAKLVTDENQDNEKSQDNKKK